MKNMNLKHLMVSFFLTLMPEFKRDLNKFLFIVPTVLRDKVRTFRHFDDRTIFENESNLHAKIASTHNISP